MPSTPKINVLIVDDSLVARESIQAILEKKEYFRVIKKVNSGEAALSYLEKEPIKPDIISMDIHLPRMDGYQTTNEITQKWPIPIIIVTGDNDELAKVRSFKALDAGALAIIEKPAGPTHPRYPKQADHILRTFRSMSQIRLFTRHKTRANRHNISKKVIAHNNPQVVAIGASTGGPPALGTILKNLSPQFNLPILIVQHISPGFETCLVTHLNNDSPIPVILAEHGMTLKPGNVYISPAHVFMGVNAPKEIVLSPRKGIQDLNQTVNHLFTSILKQYQSQNISILLTGMGNDGATSLKALKDLGSCTIIQDEASCVVYGMPGAAANLNAESASLDPLNIAHFLNNSLQS